MHTAGLLHDLGKEALPDHILLGRNELHPAERRLIERHPADAPACCCASRAWARWRPPCSRTTSASTGAAIPTGSWARASP